MIKKFHQILDNGIKVKDQCIKLMKIVKNIEIHNIDLLMIKIK